MQKLQRDYELESGLSRLKYSFGLYAITAVVSWIPLVGSIASIIGLVAIILLIMGWRALGRSNLNGSNSYQLTSNILIITIVLTIIIAVVGAIVTVASFIANMPPGAVQNSTDLFALPAFQSFMTNFFAVIVIAALVALIGQIKSALSLRQLSKELTESKIGISGNLLILSYLVGGVSIILLFTILPGLLSSLPASSGIPSQMILLSDLFGGNFVAFGFLSLGEIVLLFVALVFGYLGLNSASSKLESLRFSTPSTIYPPPPPSTSSFSGGGDTRYCGSCGNRIQQGASFCVSCGAKVSD